MDTSEDVEEVLKFFPPAEKARITRALKKIEDSAERKLRKLQSTIDTYSEKLVKLEARDRELSDREKAIADVESELNEPRTRAQEILDRFEFFLVELEGDEVNEGTKNKVEMAYKEIEEIRSKVKNLSNDADDAREVLYGVDTNEADNGAIGKLYDTQVELEKLIEKSSSFLGRVTTASLSNDFNSSRKSYGGLSLFAWLFAAIPLSALGWIAYESLKNGFTVPAGMTMLEFVAIRTLLAFPLLALSGFAASVAFRWDRLAAEYRHKHSVAKSFEGYKSVVEELYKDGSDKEMLQKLYDKALDAFGHNPNSNADGADKPNRFLIQEIKNLIKQSSANPK
ncbi:hypothetical protein [Microbulbifer pacificus]|uniref:hypothetical protein n=1 Tax=Microbulbifer pacificus TaxID=407164 RepID=UPI000CF4579F|nr:hypothetical protein [Microbulbifer pacificus]